MDVYELNEEYVHMFIKHYDMVNRNIMTVLWDIENELLHNLMVYESNLLRVDDNRIRSCFWVNTIKDVSFWETGMIIYINARSWGDGEMKVDFSSVMFYPYSSIIDENGYFLVKEYNEDIGYGNLIKFPCLYNDFLDRDADPYVLK
jgi:hypothetical protein